MNSSKTAAAPPPSRSIPPILHFIWIGGIINQNKIDNLAAWARKCPTHEVRLYIDKKRILETLLISQRIKSGVYFTKSADTQKEKKIKFKYIKKINALIRKLNKLNIKVIDINEDELTDDYILYEIYRAQSNYGAASDLLRLKILYRYGGIYMDCDIEPADLKSLPTILKAKLGVLFKPSLGNDIIAAEKHNQLIYDFIVAVRSNYDKSALQMSEIKKAGKVTYWTVEKEKEEIKHADYEISHFHEAATYYYNTLYSLHKNYYRFALTLERAGPLALKKFLIDKGLARYIREDIPSNIMYFRKKLYLVLNVDDEITLDTTYFKMVNSGKLVEWEDTSSKTNPYYDTKEILKKTMNSIIFEINHMGLLNLTSHIKNIQCEYDYKRSIPIEEAKDCKISREVYMGKDKTPHVIPIRMTETETRTLICDELLKPEYEPLLKKITGLGII